MQYALLSIFAQTESKKQNNRFRCDEIVQDGKNFDLLFNPITF